MNPSQNNNFSQNNSEINPVFDKTVCLDREASGSGAASVKQKDSEYIMPTYARFDVAPVYGKAAAVYDADGKKYIDFGAGIGVNSLGCAEPGWVNAVTAQLGKLQHISNLYYSPVQTELAELLCKLSGLSKVFFANSGAEANECAIKLARKYSFDKYGEGRGTVVTLENSFHGRTITTLSATGQESFHNYFFPFTGGFKYAPANGIAALKDILTEDVCALMMEPIQGEGGVCPLDAEYIKAASALCSNRDILLIFDEVQTGIGRTGRMFGYENFGIIPDIVTLAKGLGGGLPIGACLCGAELSGVLSAGTHGTTFGGNPVVCAGAVYILNTLSDPDFLNNIKQNGEYIKQRLLKMKNVKSVRGMGLMLGIETDNIPAREAAEKALENGLMILTAKTLLRLLPPLNITRGELDEGLEILERTLSA